MHILTWIHEWFRWIVLAAGAGLLIKYLLGVLRRRGFSEQDRRLLKIFIRILEFQVLTGLIPVIAKIITGSPRILTLAHSLVGLGSLGVLYWTVGRDQNQDLRTRFRVMLTALFGSAVLITAALFTAPGPQVYHQVHRLTGHSEAVRSVAFSPDGNTLASGSFDGRIILWDPEAGSQIRSLDAHQDAVRGIAYSPDGAYLASVSFNQTLKIWKIPDLELIHTIQAHQASINKVLFSPDGEAVLTASLDNTIHQWDLATGTLLREIENDHQGGILSAAFVPGSTVFASGGVDGTIRLQDLEGDAAAYLGAHQNWVYDLAVSPEGDRLVSASTDQTVKIWDLISGQEISTLEDPRDAVQAVVFTPGNQHLISGTAGGHLNLWSLTDLTLVTSFSAHDRGILDLAYSPDGQILASSSADGTIKLWQVDIP